MKRESFSTRTGFLLVSAGCAIGIGNVWKFPYIAGQYGGGVFVLWYLLFLAVMGAPILTMELAVGRASGRSAITGMKKLEAEGGWWHYHGWVCLLGSYVLMMFYTTVSGWMADYCVKFLDGTFDGLPDSAVEGVFDKMLASPGELLLYTGLTVLLGVLVCSLGLRRGVEKITSVVMVCLFLLLIVLAVHSMSLPGAGEGLRFYLRPDFARAREAGLGKIITAAMNQSFFTLSVGIASMEIFGSYMSRERTILGESIRICTLDTIVTIASGLIIFPACFSYGVRLDQGPLLIFAALPKVFLHMQSGQVWGAMFFLFLTFASFSTVIAVFENIIDLCSETFGWSRAKSSLINLVVLFVTAVPCVLGLNVWKGVKLPGGRGILEMEDFLVSNLLLPIGSLVYLLFCVSRKGWGFENYLAECNKGQGLRMSAKLKNYFRFVLPVLILILLIQGLI